MSDNAYQRYLSHDGTGDFQPGFASPILGHHQKDKDDENLSDNNPFLRSPIIPDNRSLGTRYSIENEWKVNGDFYTNLGRLLIKLFGAMYPKKAKIAHTKQGKKLR